MDRMVGGCMTIFTHKWSVVLLHLLYYIFLLLRDFRIHIHTLWDCWREIHKFTKFYTRVYFNAGKCYGFIQEFIGCSIQMKMVRHTTIKPLLTIQIGWDTCTLLYIAKACKSHIYLHNTKSCYILLLIK